MYKLTLSLYMRFLHRGIQQFLLPYRTFFRFAIINIYTDLKNVSPLWIPWLWECYLLPKEHLAEKNSHDKAPNTRVRWLNHVDWKRFLQTVSKRSEEGVSGSPSTCYLLGNTSYPSLLSLWGSRPNATPQGGGEGSGHPGKGNLCGGHCCPPVSHWG